MDMLEVEIVIRGGYETDTESSEIYNVLSPL